MTYATIDNYQIVAVIDDNEKLTHFIVCDRNGERVTDKTFELASDAIDWAYNNFRGLL